METVSPSIDRIGAALRALRQTHSPEAGDRAALAVKCLHAVIAELAANGVSPDDLQPLADLEGLVGHSAAQGQASNQADQAASQASNQAPPLDVSNRDRRHGLAPSTTLLARAAVLIDLLVKAGRDEPEAAQTVMHRLLAAGVPPPAHGGDSRGWRNLLAFRNTLLQGGGPEDAKYEYRTFARELEGIPPNERVARVLDERLWDRRRRPR